MLTWIDLALFGAGFVSWGISTLAAGGGSILIVGAIAAIVRAHAVAPTVTICSALASPARMILLWRHIDWRVVRWYMPGATGGAMAGGWLFTHAGSVWLHLIVAAFLISTVWQYHAGRLARSFSMRLPYFLPVSFVSGLISAVVGASGLLVNPFYLNYGLIKESMLATRAVNSIAIQIIKIVAYLMFGALTWQMVRYGVEAGLGAVSAIWVINPWLRHLSSRRFRELAILVMLLAGLLILWQQRTALLALVTMAR